MEHEYDADGFWIMRSAVYVAFDKKTDGKLQLHEDKNKEACMARHGMVMDKWREKELANAVIKGIETGEFPKGFVLKKNSMAKPRTEVKRKIPVGSDFDKESEVNLKWDYKRVYPTNDPEKVAENFKTDVLTKWIYCAPYLSVLTAYEAERYQIHKKRGIGKPGRKRKKPGRKPKWTSEREGWRERKRRQRAMSRN